MLDGCKNDENIYTTGRLDKYENRDIHNTRHVRYLYYEWYRINKNKTTKKQQ